MRRIRPELHPILIDSHLLRQDPEEEEDEEDEEDDENGEDDIDDNEDGGNDDGYSE
jgi:hypothetical protein